MQAARDMIARFTSTASEEDSVANDNREQTKYQTNETDEVAPESVSSEDKQVRQDAINTTTSSDHTTATDSYTADKRNAVDFHEDKSASSKGSSASDPSHVQSSQQGPDPALVGDARAHPKLSGSGVDGSHSAVFGLTPDGHKHDDTAHGTAPVVPAHSKETTVGKKGKKNEIDEN